MPREEIDYSNTIIYTITCVDLTIQDIYVGHTTNFVQRKHAHKQGCNNVKSSNYKCKLYKIIRENGGWNNWTMKIIDFIHCTNGSEARQKEQEYYESLNATLNSVEPYSTPKIIEPLVETKTYHCETCNIYTLTEKQLNKHYNTPKHTKKVDCNTKNNENHDTKQNSLFECDYKFCCEKCHYNTSNKKDYNKHCLTRKHTNALNFDSKTVNKKSFSCECSKSYPYMASLYNHKKNVIIKKKKKNHKSTLIIVLK